MLLGKLVHRLRAVFHSPCAWNYQSAHLQSSGDALRLSSSLAQSLTPVESTADLSSDSNTLL